MWNTPMKLFEFGPVVQEKVSFKDINYLELCPPPPPPLCSTEQNHFCKFGRGHHGEHFCEVTLN